MAMIRPREQQADIVEAPARTRRLGRPLRCTAENLPARLTRWHSPRANRWEHIDVVAGTFATEWLEAANVALIRMRVGERRWVAPGTRWRVPGIDADTCFELSTHADETTAADAPQTVRAALLDSVSVVRVGDGEDALAVLQGLRPGEAKLLRAERNCSAELSEAITESAGRWSWHPLDAIAGRCTALLVCPAQPANLPDYMGRDHAVIEAALAGALRVGGERMRWLRCTLARHLAIEEKLLFPAYLDADGRADWVRALRREHADLREHLQRLEDRVSRRRFLLLLDGHDEKEEQIIYPDIVARATRTNGELAKRSMVFPPVA